MTATQRAFVLCAALLVAHPVAGQTTGDPSGHWEGRISAPFGEVPIAIDLGRNGQGGFVATYSRHDTGIEGFPLSDVSVIGDRVTFTINANGGGVFNGSFAGHSMSGTFVLAAGAVPFGLSRTGDARFAPPVKSAAISKALEGTWTGGFAIGGDDFRVRMTLTNHTGGVSTGTIVRLDDRTIELPVRIREEGSLVTIGIPSAGSSFTGTLNAAGTEIVGTYTERELKTPLTFTRVP